VSTGVRRYAFVQVVVVLIATVKVLELAAVLPAHQTATLAFYVILSITNIGGLLEGRAWAFTMELARQVTLAISAVTLGALHLVPATAAVAGGLFCVVSAAWVERQRREPAAQSLEPGVLGSTRNG
jgi:hypothetical protein